jgi:nitroreductase
MERLLAGDVTDQVRAALGTGLADDTDQFLLLSVKFWKNAFKYNTFSYHVVTTDVGTLLGTWNLWARSCGLPLPAVLWFAEPALNDLLGLATEAESVFAVVPLRWAGFEAGTGLGQGAATFGVPAVTRTERERSARVLRFAWTDRVHAAAVQCGPRPAPEALRVAVPSPPPRTDHRTLPPGGDGLAADTRTALRERRSSFGRFSGVPAMTTAELSSVLAVAAAGRILSTDVTARDASPLTRLAVFINHVAGTPAGVYDYDPDGGRLGVVDELPPGQFLQAAYFLNNYNLEQAAAVVAVIGRPEAVLAAVGDRGYRMLNIEVGAVGQAVYTGAAAVGVGCGAIFGFENVSVRERLGCADDEWPILLIMLGHERSGGPAIDYRLAE